MNCIFLLCPPTYTTTTDWPSSNRTNQLVPSWWQAAVMSNGPPRSVCLYLTIYGVLLSFEAALKHTTAIETQTFLSSSLGNADVRDWQCYFFINTTKTLVVSFFPNSTSAGEAARQHGRAAGCPFSPPPLPHVGPDHHLVLSFKLNMTL